MTLKIGIIGFGKMGMFHGALINSLPDVEIVAITDTSKWVLKAFKSVMPQVKYFLSYEEMLESCALDAVIITTPTFSHVPIAQKVIKKNINFFVEKPLGISLKSVLELQESALANNIKGMVGFCARYYGTFQKAKDVLDLGKLGKIKSVIAENYLSDIMRKETGWRFNKAVSGGGVVIDYSIHMIDLLYWYFGEVSLVNATTKQLYSEQVEDEVQALFNFKSGVSATLKSSWSNPNYRKSYMRIEVVGDEASMEVTDQTISIVYANGKKDYLSYPDLYVGSFLDIGGPHFSLQMKDFYSYVTSNFIGSNTIHSAVEVQRLVAAIYQSAEKLIAVEPKRI